MIENPSSKEVISLVNVNKTYFMGENQVHALQNVSFSIKEGELVSIMGPSGSGKSTCMNMIGCLDRPTSGQVFIDGKGTFEMTEKDLSVLRNRTVGFVFQQYHLLATMNVLENVMLPLRYKGIPRSERKTLALEVLGKYKKYTHGEAVVQGIFFILNYAYAKNLITYSYYRLSQDLLTKYNFKSVSFKYSPSNIVEIMKKDKKANQAEITFIIPYDKKKVKEIKLSETEVLNMFL